MLNATFTKQGYKVEEFVDGQELVERLKSPEDLVAPSLVISDVNMPRLSGLDALHCFREHFSTVPVILITAFGDVRTHKRAESLGANIVINKPFSLEAISSHVEKLLKQ